MRSLSKISVFQRSFVIWNVDFKFIIVFLYRVIQQNICLAKNMMNNEYLSSCLLLFESYGDSLIILSIELISSFSSLYDFLIGMKDPDLFSISLLCLDPRLSFSIFSSKRSSDLLFSKNERINCTLIDRLAFLRNDSDNFFWV